MKFYKYQGCGNDYVCIDCFNQKVENPSELSRKISDRHFGIGSDGLILILPSDVADAKMRIFNADGSEGITCGNGLRCVCKYLYDKRQVAKDKILIETLAGVSEAQVISSSAITSVIKVDMGTPKEIKNIDINIDGLDIRQATFVSMGNPHLVIVCDEIENLDLNTLGPKIQHLPIFPDGINIEFVKVNSDHDINMRVFERGSGETLACGSGACASAWGALPQKFAMHDNAVRVYMPGGVAEVTASGNTTYLTAMAELAFEGEYSQKKSR